ncbi:hypothetical protein PTI98_004577 [Pleurotus ostreatus]|nr:hypothetical protein PTI98_004577 [Pleurotus ostreatus]
MQRFFQKMSVDKPVSRNNYFIQVVPPEPLDAVDPEELAWGKNQNGEEDVKREGGLGAKSKRYQRDANAPKPIVEARTLRLRSERQTLRRLPKSGVIVFGIRTYMTPVGRLVEEGVGERLAGAVRGWSEDIDQYKGSVLYKEALLAYLDCPF